jgi:MoxR-like ATPase
MTARQNDPAHYYSDHFTRAELADLDRALGDSLRGEIGMLRVVLRRFFERAAQEADDIKALADALTVLGLSVTRLARVIQTERQLQGGQADELGEALTRSMAAVLEELRGATGPERSAHGG